MIYIIELYVWVMKMFFRNNLQVGNNAQCAHLDNKLNQLFSPFASPCIDDKRSKCSTMFVLYFQPFNSDL